MYIRAKKDCDLPSFKIPKGHTCEVPESQGRLAISRGEATEVDVETAVKYMTKSAESKRAAKAKQSDKPAVETR